MLVALALLLSGCSAGTQPKVTTLAVDAKAGGGMHSWSWNVVSGAKEVDPLLVGVESREDSTAALTISRLRRDGHLQRVRQLPDLGGPVDSAVAGSDRLGAYVVGASVDAAGTPHAFVLRSADGTNWRRLALRDDLAFVPTAVTSEGSTLFVAGAEMLWVVNDDGSTAQAAPPSTRSGDQTTGLAIPNDRLWALVSDPAGESVSLASSSDRGRSWSEPQPVRAPGVDRVEAAALVAHDGRLYLTGKCGSGGQTQSCLLTGDGTSWTSDTPFPGWRGMYLLPPAFDARGNLLTAAGSGVFSEGWLASRTPAGAWTANRYDLVGDRVGTVAAVGAGRDGEGFAVVVEDDRSTRLVLTQAPIADAKTDVITVGGPGNRSWVSTLGQRLAPASQVLVVHAETQPVSGGSYLVLKKSRPAALAEQRLIQAEWRPALARTLDAFVAEQSDNTTVLAGSESPKDKTQLGRVRVYATKRDGSWSEVATDLAGRFDNQIATTLAADAAGWLLATAYPSSELATIPARIFASSDGQSWREEEAPTPPDGKPSRIDAVCRGTGDTILALGSTGTRGDAAAWLRSDGRWQALEPPPGDGHGCVTVGGMLLAHGLGDRQGRLWRLDGAAFKQLDALGAGTTVSDTVALDGGVALVGTTRSSGLVRATAWFSRDAQEWEAVPLGPVLGGTAYATAALQDDAVVVFASGSDGIHAWRVTKPW